MDAVWGREFKVAFLKLKSNHKPDGHRKPRMETLYLTKCHKGFRKLFDSNDLSRSRKELYRKLVVGSTSDLLEEQLGWSLKEILSQWN